MLNVAVIGLGISVPDGEIDVEYVPAKTEEGNIINNSRAYAPALTLQQKILSCRSIDMTK